MPTQALRITFPGASKAEANRYAQNLADELASRVINLQTVEATRDNDESQDFGATLVLVLGTAAVTEVARGIHSWLARQGTVARLSEGGVVVLENLESKDIATIAKALSKD